MAITIEQIPSLLSVNKQNIIFMVSSTEYAQPGFKFKVDLNIVDGSGDVADFTTSLYYSPNISGSCVVDLMPFALGHRSFEYDGLVHSQAGSDGIIYGDDFSSLLQVSEFTIYEYWIVGGVLTLNPDSGVSTSEYTYIGNGWFNPSLGFQPNINGSDVESSYTLDGNTKRVLSDRKWDTHKWPFATKFGFTEDGTNTFIPVREEDFGILSWCNGPVILPTTEATQMDIVLYDVNGGAHSYSQDIETGEVLAIAFVYPANLNANVTASLPQPEDYPDWRYYTVQFQDDGNVAVSMTYVFYNADLYGQHDCNYDVIRIAWQNSRCGWDYFNFIKKSEQSLTMDRRRYHRIKGNYATAAIESMGGGFTYGASESGLTERAVITEQFQSITSDWIQEGEYELLRSLMASRQVHWVQDDGSFLPVLLEQSDFLVRKIRNGKLYNVEFKLKYANPYVI